MNYFSQQYNKKLNEARGVTRTIDPKLWASVSSGCSKTYKNDLGVSAKPIGTRDQLLQRFVAGLIILKQQCPITENDMKNCPAFTQWANKLLDMGVTMDEVHKLWNENCGKLPKVDTTIINEEPINDDSDLYDDEVIDDTPNNTSINVVEPNDDIIDDIDSPENNDYSEEDLKNGEYTPESFLPILHKLLLPINNVPSNPELKLHGCSNPKDAFKILTLRDLLSEKISNCENLDELKAIANERNMLFACRVIGGDPEEVIGDVVWHGNNTPESYYIVIGNNILKIYYKEGNGDLSLSFTDTLNNLGIK